MNFGWLCKIWITQYYCHRSQAEYALSCYQIGQRGRQRSKIWHKLPIPTTKTHETVQATQSSWDREVGDSSSLFGIHSYTAIANDVSQIAHSSHTEVTLVNVDGQSHSFKVQSNLQVTLKTRRDH